MLPKERDFVQTCEGMFFCVSGYLHPPDRYTAYLKYSPDPAGKWRDGAVAYRRELPTYHVDNVSQTIDYLAAHYPHYVHHCPVRDIRFSMVPRERVLRYYRPQERLEEILKMPRDPLEEEVCDLMEHLTRATGLPAGSFGITGSTLIGLHDPAFSDIDLLVYGATEALALRGLQRAGRLDFIRAPNPEQVQDWAERVIQRFPLSMEEARIIGSRRWNYGFFGERYLSLHPARRDDEIDEVYGERIYRARGPCRVRLTVVDSSEAIFLPAIYRVAQVEVLEGSALAREVVELVSFEGLFGEAAEAGDRIEVLGKLELVNGQARRLVVGAAGVPYGGLIYPPAGGDGEARGHG